MPDRASFRRAISRSSNPTRSSISSIDSKGQVLPDLVPALPGQRVLGKGIESHIVLLPKKFRLRLGRATRLANIGYRNRRLAEGGQNGGNFGHHAGGRRRGERRPRGPEDRPAARSRSRPTGRFWSGSRPPESTVRTSSSARAATRRPPARPIFSGSRSPAEWSPQAPACPDFPSAMPSWRLVPGGGYADYAVVHETNALRGAGRARRWSRPAPCPRPISPSGPTSSSAGP